MGYFLFRLTIAIAIDLLAWALVFSFLGDLFVVHIGMHRPWGGVDFFLALPGFLVLVLWLWRWGGGWLLAWIVGVGAYVWALSALQRRIALLDVQHRLGVWADAVYEWLLVVPAVLIVCWMIWQHIRNVAAERRLAMDEQRLLRTAPMLSLTGRLWQQDRQH